MTKRKLIFINFGTALVGIFIFVMALMDIPSHIAGGYHNGNSSNSRNILINTSETSFATADGQPAGYNITIPARSGDPFQLAINQTAVLTPNNIRIQFLDVSEDSRCPSLVACIYAGQVTVSFRISDSSSVPLIMNLTLGPLISESSAREFGSISIRLLQVEPYPTGDQEIPKSDYRATVLVSKILHSNDTLAQ